MNIKKIGPFIFYGVIAVLFCTLIISGYHYSNIQKDDGVRINLAGRQRMLSQSIFKEILLYRIGERTPDDIFRLTKIFNETQNALIYGGNAPVDLSSQMYRNLPPSDDSAAIKILIDAKSEWEPIEKNLTVYIKNGSPDSLNYIISHDRALLSKIDNSVYAMQISAEKNTAVMRVIIISSFIIISFLLVINLIRKIRALRQAGERIKGLETLLPICSNCKKIRIDNDNPMDPESWTTIEKYLYDKKDMSFTHGICPECVKKLYPGMFDDHKK